MIRYIAGRLLATIPVLSVVALFTFFLLHLTPGDPAAIIAGDHGTAEDVEEIRDQLGLNRPLAVQLSIWIGRVLRGDLGESLFRHQSVAGLIMQRAGATISLVLFTEIFSIAVAIPLGILAAWYFNTWVDRTVMVVTVLGLAVPIFWLGFMLIWVFGLKLGWLPVADLDQFYRISDNASDDLTYLALR